MSNLIGLKIKNRVISLATLFYTQNKM